MKANTRKESGAKKGKKKGASPSEAPFSSSTIATFRKLDKHDSQLPEFLLSGLLRFPLPWLPTDIHGIVLVVAVK